MINSVKRKDELFCGLERRKPDIGPISVIQVPEMDEEMYIDTFHKDGRVERTYVDPTASRYGTQPGDFSEAEPPRAIGLGVSIQTEANLLRKLHGEHYLDTRKIYAERDAALARAEAAERQLKRALYDRDLAEKELLAVIAATETDDTQPPTDVDRVIEQLDRRIIGAPERTKLRGALDKADAPDTSRTGQDAAVGRALRLG